MESLHGKRNQMQNDTTLKAEIFRLYEEGKSYSQIAKILGCAKSTISYHCGKGQKEKTMNRQKQSRHRNIAFIREQKQGRPCADCREDYPYWMLEFDHLPEYEKLFTIGGRRARDFTIKQLVDEIAKCDIVCSNCHKNRTYWRLNKNGEYADTEDYYND
jgi:DNA-binding CsgD family transcriptional regulator